MIVATAGHIDHGKTTLVKTLTGIDTDRLPEERTRGISIDLGFAHGDLGGDHQVSFVDVPGHERFIRNMLAGVCGIDASLLVVAADDGLMPQTLEHLSILDLLDVRHGAAVLTKIDLVDRDRVAEVKAGLTQALRPTSLADVPIFEASATTGEGLDALREWLRSVAHVRPRLEGDAQHFRLAVDRAFTLAGWGTVVTGTVQSGRVSPGDVLTISPLGLEVRVRGVQVHGCTVPHASTGQRCALNLHGASLDQVARGDWILHPAVDAPTSRMDARLRVLTTESGPLAHWTPVHVHLGTRDVPGRVAISGESRLAPGESGYVQIILQEAVSALHGDRFVVRDQSARRTLGGGVIVDPFAPARKRRADLRVAELGVMERRSPAQILSGLLDLRESGVDLQTLSRALNLSPEQAAAMRREVNPVVIGTDRPVAVSRASADLLTTRILGALREFHRSSPQVVAMPIDTLREAVQSSLPTAAFQYFVRELANRQFVVLTHDTVRLKEHESTANADDERLWARVRGRLTRAGVKVPLVADLAAHLEVSEQVLRDFLHRKSRTGEVLRVTADRFCLREVLAQLAATTAELSRASDNGYFSAGQFRDVIGTGRGLAIHYLEFFDALGITRRSGDLRSARKDFVPLLGPADPLPLRIDSGGEH